MDGMSRILVRRGAVGHDHLKLVPDRIAPFPPIWAVFKAGAAPDDLVNPGFPASSRNLAVPDIVQLGLRRPRRAVKPGVVPGLGSFHHQMVVGIGVVASHLAVQPAVHAVGRSHKDPGLIIVTKLVKSPGCPGAGKSSKKKGNGDNGNNRSYLKTFSFLLDLLLFPGPGFRPGNRGQVSRQDHSLLFEQ